MSLQQLWQIAQHKDLHAFHKFVNKLDHEKCDNLFHATHKKSGDNVTHMLARHGKLDMLQIVHEEWHVSLEMVNLDGKSPLHEASAAGHTDAVKYIISTGASVDPLKRAGWTPLMMACTKTHNLQTVEVLIDAGANPHLINKDGWNCFHIACRAGDVEMLSFLHQTSPTLWNTVSANGRTPMHTAALHGHSQVVQFLINQCKSSTCTTDSCGSSPFIDAVRSGDRMTMDVLLEADASALFGINQIGFGCMHVAAEANQTISLVYLSHKYPQGLNCQVNKDNMCKGQTPLHIAYKENNTNAIDALIKLGANTDVKDSNGRIPSQMFIKRTWPP